MDVLDFVSVNLKLKKSSELTFPYLDYGFLYGYGLFESIRIANGKPLLLPQHLARLRRGSIILDILLDYGDEAMMQSVSELIQENKVQDGILNLYLTPGNRSSDPAKLGMGSPFLLMVIRPWPAYDPEERLHLDVREESFQRTPLDRFKTMSWMKNVLERRLSLSFNDVLLYTHKGEVLETTSSNLYFVKDNHIVTPKSSMVLQGVTRQFLINHQTELDVTIEMREVSVGELATFDEVFLTNSLRGVSLVASVEDYPSLKSKDVSQKVFDGYNRLILNS